MTAGAVRARRRLAALSAGVAGLCLFAGLLLLTIELVAHDFSVYRASFVSTGAPRRTGLTEDQLLVVTRHVMDYSTGRRPELQFDLAVIDGGPGGRPAFTERELRHMVDVRRLFGYASAGRFTVLAVSALAVLGVFRFTRGPRARPVAGEPDGDPSAIHGLLLARGLHRAGVLWALLCLGLVVFMALDFNSFWDVFHLSLFDNDLWLLPEGSLLIEMMPESLFEDLALRIAGLFVLELVIALSASGLYLRRLRRPGSRAGVARP